MQKRNPVHGVQVRAEAAKLFDEGLGHKSAAKKLGVPRGTVEQWQVIYRAVGIEGLLKEDRKHASYSWEVKVAAARAVLEEGFSKPEAMERFGIRSLSPLAKWCRDYSDGGPEALRPKPKGRPPGPPSTAKPMTREQELEAENRRLRAEVAYLKKLQALEAAKRAPGKNAK